MSHFSVLVIGPDVEGQLAPFDENTQVEEHVVRKLSDEDKMGFLDFYKRREAEKETKKGQAVTEVVTKIEEFPAYYQKHGSDWNGNQWRVDSDGIWKEYSTYNPDSKWDWYQLGGRWGGMLLLKPDVDTKPVLDFHWGMSLEEKRQMVAENRTDQARKGEIDWERMRVISADKANETYDEFEEEVKKAPSEDFVSSRGDWWEKDAYPNDKHPSSPRKDYATFKDMIWDMWRAHIASRTGVTSIFEPKDVPSREDYVKDQALLSTFAVLDHGEWYEQGEMGWFGMSSATPEDEKKFKENFFERWIEPLDDDTLISIVDCHI